MGRGRVIGEGSRFEAGKNRLVICDFLNCDSPTATPSFAFCDSWFVIHDSLSPIATPSFVIRDL